jgi:ABC-type multidrug transport system fused ATPase/permease subunit
LPSEQLAPLYIVPGAEAAGLLAKGEKLSNPEETADASLVICMKTSRCPLLRARKDGRALQLIEGRRLRDIAPGCQALRGIDTAYDIVGVNSATTAEEMAQELCKPRATLWIDLWDARFAGGMRVQLEDLSAGYGNEKNVLHGINVEIPACCKMGFAGKTGCGKSTTLICMLRILEPRGGRIVLGGLDSQKLGLNVLRNIVGLVPQDPTIFEGTVRHNVDPFHEFPDASIWEALTNVKFTPFVREHREGLDWEITKEGGNLSLGQRQLLSMARMVIRQPPVLLLDECTSALDPCTQEAVQNTLLHKFPSSTIIAVAHRVETILSFDRITVFDLGRVAEHGTVEEVLSIKNGIFARMVKASK